MSLSPTSVASPPARWAAHRIDWALSAVSAVRPVRHVLGEANVDLAYEVQREFIRMRVAGGAEVVGRSIGTTVPAGSATRRAGRSHFGTLLAEMHHQSGAVLDPARLIAPRCTAEIAFVLGHDLGAGAGADVVRRAVETLYPALHILDPRIEGPDHGIVDLIADNNTSAAFVLGPPVSSLTDVEDSAGTVSIMVNGKARPTGSAMVRLRDSLLSLTWLAEVLALQGSPLSRGDIVLAGPTGQQIDLARGDHVAASFSALGDVSLSIAEPHDR